MVRAKRQINELFVLCDLGQAHLPGPLPLMHHAPSHSDTVSPWGGGKDSMSQHDLSPWAVQQWGESSPSAAHPSSTTP